MSDYIFHPFVLRIGFEEYVAIKHIESIAIIETDSEEDVVDKLKGDCHLYVRMVSGREYRISMMEQYLRFEHKHSLPDDPKELRQIIFEKWYRMVSANQS